MKQQCPKCHQAYEFAPSQTGQMFSCLECGHDFIITGNEPAVKMPPSPRNNRLPVLIGIFSLVFLVFAVAVFLFFNGRRHTSVPPQKTAAQQSEEAAEKILQTVKSGDTLQVAKLLRNCDLEKYGWMLLSAAVNSGSQDMLLTLLSSGIDLNQCKGSKGETALHIAVSNRNFATFKFLLQHGASLPTSDDYCDTLWGLAATNGSVKILEYLAVAQQLPQDNPLYEKSIFRALRKGYTECVKILMDKYMINVVDMQGNTLLLAAFQENNVEIAKSAIARQADTTLTNKAGESAYFIALKNRNKELANLIDFSTVNLNFQTNDGTTLPIICVKAGNDDALPHVINEKNINMTDSQGKTALYYACEQNDVASINILLSKKASLNSDVLERSPVYIAIVKNNARAVEALGYNKITFNHQQQDQAGNTLLMLAAATGNAQIFRYFSLQDFDLFHKNKSGKTVLDIAVEKNASYKNMILQRMDSLNLEKVIQELEKINSQDINEQANKIASLQQQMSIFPETKNYLDNLKSKLNAQIVNRATDNIVKAIEAAEEDRYYESAIKTLEKAIADNPQAQNLQEAKKYLAKLKLQLKNR